MMTPRSSSALGSFLAMRSACSRTRLNVATRLRSMTRRNSSRGCGPFLETVRLAAPPPATFTPMWIAPNSSTTRSIAASTAVSSVMSSGMNRVPLPISAATFSPSEIGRSSIAIFAPPRAKSIAVARAIPDAPPATTATLPSTSIASSSWFVVLGEWTRELTTLDGGAHWGAPGCHGTVMAGSIEEERAWFESSSWGSSVR